MTDVLELPAWPVVDQSPPVIIRGAKPTARKVESPYKVAACLPDMQVGYYLDSRGKLQPTHDERAIDVVLQVLKDAKVDRLILHGDNLDFPELSLKYRLTPAFANTTQKSIDRMAELCGQMRQVVGDECGIDWLEGNHELRSNTYIIDNAKAAFGLRRSCDTEGWPVLSIPHLCRLSDHNINFISGYPANEVWINDRLRVIHGHVVSSNGSTAHRYLGQERVSTIYGHIHRREWAERTRVGANGKAHTILAMSPGTLARVDGAVPSVKSGMDLFGQPVPAIEDWQQGFALITYAPRDGKFVPEQVPVFDGWCIWRGKEYRSRV